MKKLLVPALALAIVAAAGAAFLLTHNKQQGLDPAELLPPDTLFFAELPEYAATAGRWRQTALFQTWQDPEVQAFLEKPTQKLGAGPEWTRLAAEIEKIEPRHTFAAVTSLDGDHPKFIAGFSFLGAKSEVEHALAEPRAQMRRAWPAGKSDLVTYSGVEIETYVEKEKTIAEAFHDNSYFISNDLDLLKQTLDRSNASGREGKASLAGAEDFKKATAPLPAGSDVRAYLKIGALTDRLLTVLKAAETGIPPEQSAALQRTKAIAYSARIEGAEMRDTLFSYAPGNPEAAVMPLRGLNLSTASTMLFYAGFLPNISKAAPAAPDGLAALAPFLPYLAPYQKALADQGLTVADALGAFGPEWSASLDWDSAGAAPGVLFQVDVRDFAKATGALTAILSSGGWTRAAAGNITLFTSPEATVPGLALPKLTIAVAPKHLVVALSAAAAQLAVSQLDSGKEALREVPAFAKAVKSVSPPTSAFGYLDVAPLLERSYGTLRPFLAMALAFNRDASQYLDAGKLPPATALARRLTPTVYSVSAAPDGTLTQSVGSITATQLTAAAVAGAASAVAPMIEQNLKGGNVDITQIMSAAGQGGLRKGAEAPKPAATGVNP